MVLILEVRSSSWLTPARPPTQLPVASACSRRWDIRSGRMALEMRRSFFLAYERSSWYFRSLTRLVKATRNRSSMRSPESFRRLLA
ncbi:MAG: hypothetical protein A4E30_00091 [Methanomassiliicoccales archaeon PtaB.Bin215]|nr:MAG: hypothetical protein A4E30_00091 [Methanomassiliicoccales archaeon PtaB.Bin215]